MTKKRNCLSFENKKEILKLLKNGARCKDILEKYSISKRTLYRIKDNMKDINDISGKKTNKKRIRLYKYKKINEFIINYIQECNLNSVPITYTLIKEYALRYANEIKVHDFKASNGWLGKLKEQYTLTNVKISGESGSADTNAAQNFLLNFLDKYGRFYCPRDIYNLDETSLFYKLLPKNTVKTNKNKIYGQKKPKERITLLLMINYNGEMFDPLIIGKSKSPRCFKGINLDDLKIKYEANKTAWITRILLENYLTNINEELIKNNRKILLIMDNCPAHNVTTFSNIQIIYLPPNTTSLLQPLDLGIIAAIKRHYKKIFLNHILNFPKEKFKEELKKINILDALNMVELAINKITQKTYYNCFKKLLKLNEYKEYENVVSEEITLDLFKFKKMFQIELNSKEFFEDFSKEHILSKVISEEVFNCLVDEDIYKTPSILENKEKANQKQEFLQRIRELKDFSLKNFPTFSKHIIELEAHINEKFNKK